MLKKRKALAFTLEQAEAHQKKHGFPPLTKAFVEMADRSQTKKLRTGRRKMTRSEHEFAMILFTRQKHDEILAYSFEGVRLAWGDGMAYKPDFSVLQRDKTITLVEVKGARIWDRDIVRFKGCRAEWKDWFGFEMHQRQKGGAWTKLL